MIHIVLFILKIIGWILLAVLGFILLAAGILLFVPVRYRGEGSCYGAWKGRLKATWLLHMISLTAVYEENLDVTIRILGFPLGRKAKEEAEKEISEDEFWEKISEELSDEEDKEDAGSPGAPVPDVHIASIEDSEEDFVYQGGERNAQDEAVKKEVTADSEDGRHREPVREEGKKTSGKERKSRGGFGRPGWPKRLKDRFLRIFKNLKAAFCSMWDKWKSLEKKVERIKQFINDKKNQELFKLLLKQIRVLFKHVLPRKIRGKVRLGFDDPYMTGQALAAAGLLYPFYRDSIQVCPSFEEQILEGELSFSGRIRLFTLTVIAGRLFLNKRFRLLLRKWMR
ncbi:DUF2953 domain-containing protein [Clostridium sp. AM58-1XD]|uniref:DUF2953 domain-containing protein n=1 Tax=Clostridium sp. AM58-1XD TaxID=2292307 RepID=UPI000E4F9BCB|nr:DUF2953 domain-containing protein [Clostridium sp. AM58-1XD]RGY99409.1 DUF2953 domain-containing protein [Clostridium sp. AM58-1XD]